MENLSKIIVEILKNKNETISFMESCTGGFLANQITNISGASDVLKVSLVTYSNEYKMKFGVGKEIIDKYTVYSIETAYEMAKKSSEFANSDWGIGVTGQLENTNNDVYYSIYNKRTQELVSGVILAKGNSREDKKVFVATKIFKNIIELCSIT